MKVTVDTHQVLYNGLDTPAFARVYSERTFDNDDGQTVLAGDVLSANYVKQVAVSFAAGIATIAPFSGGDQIDSTVFGIGGVLSTYTLSLHNASGALLEIVYSGLKVSNTVSSTTWQAIAVYTNAPSQPYRYQYYDTDHTFSKPEILSLIAPVAYSLSYTYSNDFAVAIAAIGSAFTLLPINAPVTVSVDTTIPSNITLVIAKTGLITIAAGKTLTIGSLVNPGNVKWITGPGNVRFTRGAVDVYRTAWFTGPVGGVDLTSGLTQLCSSVSANGGGEIKIPEGSWNTTGLIDLPTGGSISGASEFSTGGTFGTVVKMTGAGSYVFRVTELKASIRLRDFTIDGNHLATNGVLLTGTQAVGGTNDILFEHISVTNCFDGIRLFATDGGWEVEAFTLSQVILNNNSNSGFRYNTLNGSIALHMPFLQVPTGGLGMWVENAGHITINDPQFQGQFDRSATGCILFSGQAQTFVVNNSQDEGFGYFLRCTNLFGFAAAPVNLNNCLIQAPIKLEGQQVVNITGGRLTRRVIIDTVTSTSVVNAKDYALQPVDYSGVAGNTSIAAPLLGSTLIAREYYPDSGNDDVHRTSTRFLRNLSIGAPPLTSAVIKAHASAGLGNQALIEWGTADNTTEVVTNKYYVYRDVGTGRCAFKGTQSGVQAYDFDGPLTVLNANVTELANFKGTNTSARITVNSNTATPNASYALQSNNADKWQLAHYGPTGGYFSIFNSTLSADAFTLDPATSIATFAAQTRVPNLLIGDTTHVPFLSPVTNYSSLGFTARQTIPTANNLISSNNDLAIDMNSSSGKSYIGQFTRLDIQGTATNPFIAGHYINIFSNSSFPGGTGTIYGNFTNVDVGGQYNSAVGGSFTATSGGSGASGLVTIKGVEATANMAHNGNTTNAFGVDSFLVSSSSSPSVVTLARGVRQRVVVNDGLTVTELRGVSVDTWTLTGTGNVTTSYGFYMDNTVDVGATKFALFLLSASPSRFSGEVRLHNIAEPANAPASEGTLYTKDNGSGKSILSVKFPTGKEQQLGIEGRQFIDSSGAADIFDGATQVHQKGSLPTAGQNDVYTVPGGKKAILIQGFTINPTAGAITHFLAVKISGVYSRINNAAVPGPANSIGGVLSSNFVFEAGEIIAVQASATGSRYDFTILLLPSTAAIKTARFIPVTGGVAQSIYQVPSGKTARTLPVVVSGSAGPFGTFAAGAVFLTNDSGANATYTTYVVPNGSVADATTQQNITAAIATAGLVAPAITSFLDPLDSIFIASTTNTASQFGWVTVVEIPQ